jgi:hypothetical protein
MPAGAPRASPEPRARPSALSHPTPTPRPTLPPHPGAHAAAAGPKLPLGKAANGTQAADRLLAPVKARVEALKKGASGKLDAWKSAVLLAWLKESGVYGLLNATSNTHLPIELREKQAQAVAVLAALTENGVLDALVKRHANGTVAAASLPAGMPALPQLGQLPLKAFNLTRGDLLRRAPRLALNATAGASDKVKSAVLLAWLRDSGVYGKLEVLNKAIGSVQSALTGAASNATHKLEGLRLESALAKDGASAEAAKVERLQALLSEVQTELHAKLNEVNEAFTNASRKVDDFKSSAVMAGVRGHATTVVDAGAKSLDAKLKAAGEAVGDASAAMDLINGAPGRLAANGTQGFAGLERVVSGLQSQVEEKLAAAAKVLAQASEQADKLKAQLPKPPAPAKPAPGPRDGPCAGAPEGKLRQVRGVWGWGGRDKGRVRALAAAGKRPCPTPRDGSR